MKHGPVVPIVYHAYKHWDNQRITEPSDGEALGDKSARELIDAVNLHYAQFSAWALRERTHRERLWKEARDSGATYLDPEETRAFFRT